MSPSSSSSEPQPAMTPSASTGASRSSRSLDTVGLRSEGRGRRHPNRGRWAVPEKSAGARRPDASYPSPVSFRQSRWARRCSPLCRSDLRERLRGRRQGGAKLSVKKFSAPPAAGAPGDSFAVFGKVANRGGRAGRVTVRFNLRRGADSGPNGIEVGAERLGRVGPGDTERFEADLGIPADLAAGEYGLSACVRKRGDEGPPRCLAAKSSMSVAAGEAPPPEPGSPDQTPPPAPSGLAIEPASPSPNPAPRLKGSASDDTSEIEVFASADCAGGPVASGPRDQFAESGIEVSVAENSTTTLPPSPRTPPETARPARLPSPIRTTPPLPTP